MMERINNIVIIREPNDITINDIIQDINKLLEDATLPEDLKLMIVTEAHKFKFEKEDMSLLNPFVIKLLKRFITFRQAFVVKSPINTAYTMIYQNIVQNASYISSNSKLQTQSSELQTQSSEFQSNTDINNHSETTQETKIPQESSNRYVVEVFSTEEAALEWLQK